MFSCDVYVSCGCILFFFKQKTAYEMRISDWSSDVCSSDLPMYTTSPLADDGKRCSQPTTMRRSAIQLSGRGAACSGCCDVVAASRIRRDSGRETCALSCRGGAGH